jgi:hypothetical protein
MKCNKNIAFLVIIFRKLHFKKKNQLWSAVVEVWLGGQTYDFYGTLTFVKHLLLCHQTQVGLFEAKFLFLMTVDAISKL